MTYVITGSCVKDDSCVEVCPVDCIHPKPGAPDFEAVEQLYIDPEVCIDCDACVEACPVDAVFPDFAKSLTRLGLIDEYQLTTVPIAIGAGRSPFAELREHLKLDVVEEERFRSGALAQILVPKAA